MDSHIYKHWTNQHGGKETTFKFEIISFFESPLERQVAEAVRISRTGSEKILNSKGEYNRCKLPRIIAVDTREVENLGDTVGNPQKDEEIIDEVFVAETEISKAEVKRLKRKESLRDLVMWGQVAEDIMDDITEEDEDILSSGDEETISILQQLIEEREVLEPMEEVKEKKV